MHRPVQKSVTDGKDTAKTISPIIFWHGIVNRGVKVNTLLVLHVLNKEADRTFHMYLLKTYYV